jgi:hypothetical protein
VTQLCRLESFHAILPNPNSNSPFPVTKHSRAPANACKRRCAESAQGAAELLPRSTPLSTIVPRTHRTLQSSRRRLATCKSISIFCTRQLFPCARAWQLAPAMSTRQTRWTCAAGARSLHYMQLDVTLLLKVCLHRRVRSDACQLHLVCRRRACLMRPHPKLIAEKVCPRLCREIRKRGRCFLPLCSWRRGVDVTFAIPRAAG